MNAIDIGSKNDDSQLSNFCPYRFVFDGVECASMEGLLQSFKFEDPLMQIAVCTKVGVSAKRLGRKRDKKWKPVQVLWWMGVGFDRQGHEYQTLLDRAFDALSANFHFQKALLATGENWLRHSIGKRDPSETVLTEHEFCSRLVKIRKRLRNEKP